MRGGFLSLSRVLSLTDLAFVLCWKQQLSPSIRSVLVTTQAVRPFPRPLRVCPGKIQLPLKVNGVSPDPEEQISASCCDHCKRAVDHGCFQSHQTVKHNLKCTGGSKGPTNREFAGRQPWTLYSNGVRQRSHSCRGLAAKGTIKRCTKC